MYILNMLDSQWMFVDSKKMKQDLKEENLGKNGMLISCYALI